MKSTDNVLRQVYRLGVFVILFFLPFFLKAQSDEIEYDGENNPLYYKDQILVSFAPEYMDTAIIDSLPYQSGALRHFIKPEVLQMLSDSGYLGEYIDLGNLVAHKVFKNLTSRITYSISRLGDTAEMPPLWSTLLIEWPNDAAFNEPQACDSLRKFFPLVQYAHPNYVAEADAIPNDAFYANDQASLHPTGSRPNGHINMETGWDVETGKPHIKVGVFDSGLLWSHEDFGNGTFAGSKIKGGWDYLLNQSAWASASDPFGHGTKVAGIIGAYRNNNLGIAGVAGGDMLAANPGVSLYKMTILDNDGRGKTSIIANAIVEGASWNPANGYGYGLHVLNNSYGIRGVELVGNDATTLFNAVHVSFKNKVVFVVSRGNAQGNQPIDNARYPASFRDELCISVGANDQTGGKAGFSMTKHNVDLIAPGVMDLVKTTSQLGNSHYLTFDGTSASAPHVAGVAALIASHVNDSVASLQNIVPEDVEHLVQKYATDISPIGYDDQTGWGRLNAGNVLQKVRLPQYKILHFESKIPCSFAYRIAKDAKIILLEPYDKLAAGTYYNVDIYQLTVNLPHSIPAGYQIIDGWKRNSSSQGVWNGANPLVPATDVNILGYNNTACAMVGFIYNFKTYNVNGQFIGNFWYPQNLNGTATFAYSLHVYNSNATGRREILSQDNISIFPNPACTNLTINATQPITQVTLSDMLGRPVLAQNFTHGQSDVSLDVNALAQGIYFCQARLPQGYVTRKIQILR